MNVSPRLVVDCSSKALENLFSYETEIADLWMQEMERVPGRPFSRPFALSILRMIRAQLSAPSAAGEMKIDFDALDDCCPERILFACDGLRKVVLSFMERGEPVPAHVRDCVLDCIFWTMSRGYGRWQEIQQARADAEREQRQASEKRHLELVAHLDHDLENFRKERELREKFVSTLSHDLRNPLGAIKLAAQLALRSGDMEDVRQKVGRVVANVDRADKMIQDLLDTNRIRAGQKLPLKVSAVNMQRLVNDLLEDLSLVHGRRFVLSCDSRLDGYWSEEGVRRIVENLVHNAVKYGDPDKDVTIKLCTVGNNIQIQVHNEGKEIPQPEQALLFEPFRRTTEAEKGKQQGWGLGLTVVRGITEAHGGKTWLYSGAGVGTTFFVELPLDARSQSVH